MMEGQRNTEERKSGGAERDGCIFSLCLSSAVTQMLGFATDTGTDNKWAGSEYKGRWLPLLPLVTRKH